MERLAARGTVGTGMKEIFVVVTMDVETPRDVITPYARHMSPSGPSTYLESDRIIRGYVDMATNHGFCTSLFLHPEIALNSSELMLDLEERGACLGMHLHCYKFGDGSYKHDIGAYSASDQRKILKEAMNVWRSAIGHDPLYFRAGYFSANDNTIPVLLDLGFRGGSLSLPGRVLPEHASVWSGAEAYPHRANLNFRQMKGDSDFIEIPVSVDYQRPAAAWIGGGYEWLIVYETDSIHATCFPDVVRSILRRLVLDRPACPVIMVDSHNDQDYTNPKHPGTVSLSLVFDLIESICAELNLKPVGATLERVCDIMRSNSAHNSST
jgi:hypothetical protein